MAAYIPFAGKNSIVEAVLALQFAQSLTPAVAEKFDDLKSEFIADFPSFEKMQVFQFTVGATQLGAATPSQSTAGFNASRLKADGKPSRVFRTMDMNISMHFLEYDHWAETKGAALEGFFRCFKILGLPSAQNPIVAVSLRFIDRFTFDGSPESASAQALLKSDTQYVAPKVLDVGNLWHSNSGWFDSVLDGQNAIHQLNVHSGIEESAFVMVNHGIHSNLVSPVVTAEVNGDSKRLSLEALFNAQHEANTVVLKNLLNDKMLVDIGLVERRS